MGMFNDQPQKPRTYEYLRYMRNGATQRITAVVRSRKPPKTPKETSRD